MEKTMFMIKTKKEMIMISNTRKVMQVALKDVGKKMPNLGY
jgi:hypothetical protein